MSRYRVPAGEVRVETRAGNSRFLTTVRRTDTAAEAQAFLREIRNEMPDATHHVYAYRVGYGASVTEGMSDDGEPSGTSGPPTLAVLRGTDIGDTALVTTRYFGGTKLGTGGLVSAYTAAAQAGLAAVTLEEKITRIALRLSVPYALHGTVKRLLEAEEARIGDEAFGAEVQIDFALDEQAIARLEQSLRDCSNGLLVPERV
jgi:uncharacterized YigZ family protein